MGFYQSLQLDPFILKQKIREATSRKEKRMYICSLFLRSLFIVLFAICFIIFITTLFESTHKPYAVVLFCMLMSIRFVDFGYKISHSIISLAIVMLSLLTAPYVQLIKWSGMGVLIHFILLSSILLATASDPKMGNASLYGFSYLFIVYSLPKDLLNKDFFTQTGSLLFLFFCWFSVILYRKHREKNRGKSLFRKNFLKDIYSQQKIWMLSYAFGISLLIVAGEYVSFQRLMWAGFAFSSIVSSYGLMSIGFKERAVDRIIGSLIGCALFIGISQFIPFAWVGILGGLALGICSTYRYKTIFNCFGALTIAASLFGVPGAVTIRIFENILGGCLGIMYIRVTEILIRKIREKHGLNH
ncbi:FUSC family protein [Enterococcus faecium]|nr:FUSC family protein [Enterococcus faecium]PQG63661.1 FUSC family protein [Enterococcus faecium]